MNRQEYREERDKAQARKTLECLTGGICMFGVPVFLMHNFGVGLGYSFLAAFGCVFGCVWVIERILK